MSISRQNFSDFDTATQSVKAEFINAIQRGMDVLMNHCGYSRERATLTLLRELQRPSESTKSAMASSATTGHIFSTTSPSDDEVSRSSRRFSLELTHAHTHTHTTDDFELLLLVDV